jgi:hypothetical protein
MPLPLEEKRNRVLLSAYHLHTTKGRHINVYELEQLADVGTEFYDILRYFGANGKGWLKKANERVRFTAEGIDKAEEMQNERFEEKERRVLQALYDNRRDHPDGLVPDEIAAALNLDLSDVKDIVVELERKGWADGGDETTWIVPAGIKELERQPEAPAVSHVTINYPQNSPISLGPHSTQNVTYYNQNTQDILPQLSLLIQELYERQFETRTEVLSELQKVETLAKGEMNPGRWQLIQTRLATTKTALEIGKIAVDSLPYWPVVWHFFFK